MKTLRAAGPGTEVKELRAGISSPDALVLFEEVLGKGADLRVKVTGGSMRPSLKGGEVLHIKKVPCSGLRRGDIILYRDRSGSPVLHRIVGKKRDAAGSHIFLTKGDALSTCDDTVAESQVLGKVWKIERAGSRGETAHIDMDSFPRRAYGYLMAFIGLTGSRGRFLLVRLLRGQSSTER